MNTEGLVQPVTCRRCKGEGRLKGVSYADGKCARCGGNGAVEGDRATLDYTKAVNGFHAWAIEQGERREKNPRRRNWAASAVRHLATHDPARYERALAAWQEGRTDLYDALITYVETNARSPR